MFEDTKELCLSPVEAKCTRRSPLDDNEDETVVTRKIVNSYQKLPPSLRRSVLSVLKDLAGSFPHKLSD